MSKQSFNTFFDSLTLFGFGFSWGGFESLLIPADPDTMRDQSHWLHKETGHLLRAHIGLEDTSDLLADLEQAFRAAKAQT